MRNRRDWCAETGNDVIKILGICYSQSYYKALECFEYVENEKLVPSR